MMGSSVDAFEQMDNGNGVDTMDYYRTVWENDPMMRATFAKVGYEAKSFDDLNNWLQENAPEFAPVGGVRFQGKCISKKLHPLDFMLMC